MLKETSKEYWQKYWQSADHQPEVVHEELLRHLLSSVDIKGKKILEVGVGMGGDSLYLSEFGADVTVLDYSETALEKVGKSAEAKSLSIKTILADAKQMPFPDRSFDIVFHQGFLEHFSDPGEYLAEQCRILKSGGLLVVDVPQRYTTYTLKKHYQMKKGQWFAGWEREYSIAELKKLVTRHGFKVIDTYGWGYYGKLHHLRYLKLGKWYDYIWQCIEKTPIKLYLNFSVGLIAKKI